LRGGIKGRSLWEEVKAQSILGSEDFVEGLIDYVKALKPSLKFPRLSASSIDPALAQLFIGRVLRNMDKGTRRSKRRWRNMVIHRGRLLTI